MMLRGTFILLFVLTHGSPTLAVEPGDDGGTINIMRPEPGKAPSAKQKNSHKTERKPPRKHVRGSSSPVYPAPLPAPQAPLPVPYQQAVTPPSTVPPLLYVPQTGRVLPNLPSSGPNGQETYQDRAARCAHQAGVYGQAAGDRIGYIGTCINQ